MCIKVFFNIYTCLKCCPPIPNKAHLHNFVCVFTTQVTFHHVALLSMVIAILNILLVHVVNNLTTQAKKSML